MRLVVKSNANHGHQNHLRQASPLSATIIASGNSLTDAIFLGGPYGNKGASYLVNQYNGGGIVSTIAKSTAPGSPMIWRWNNATTAPDAKADIANYQLLVLTDASSNFNTNTYQPTQDALPADALLWANHVWTNGNGGAGGELILWAPWARQDVADIEAQYQRRFMLWPKIQDYCNARLPAGKKPVRLIPGAWLWHQFWLDQQNGATPSPTWYDDLFADDVHQYELGAYIASLLHVVCLFGIDPYELADAIPGIQAPTPGEVEYIKSRVSSLVRSFGRAGVDTSGWQ